MNPSSLLLGHTFHLRDTLPIEGIRRKVDGTVDLNLFGHTRIRLSADLVFRFFQRRIRVLIESVSMKIQSDLAAFV